MKLFISDEILTFFLKLRLRISLTLFHFTLVLPSLPSLAVVHILKRIFTSINTFATLMMFSHVAAKSFAELSEALLCVRLIHGSVHNGKESVLNQKVLIFTDFS